MHEDNDLREGHVIDFDRLIRWLKDIGPNYLEQVERCGGQPTAEGFIDYLEKAIRANREIDRFFRALNCEISIRNDELIVQRHPWMLPREKQPKRH
jgi:hypothetical protein